MARQTFQLFSGVSRGGDVDTLDEGYIGSATAFSGGEYNTDRIAVRTNTDPIPEWGGAPDFGHSAVGFFDFDTEGRLNIEFRGFWRFDFHGIDRSAIVSARLFWDVRKLAVFSGFPNDVWDAKFEAGWNVVGAALQANDWGRSYAFELFTLHKAQWANAEGIYSKEITDLSIFRAHSGDDERFDVRIIPTNYIAADTGWRVDLSSGDNAKTDPPYLLVVTDSSPRKIPAKTARSASAAPLSTANPGSSVLAGTSANSSMRAIPSRPAVLHGTTRKARIIRKGNE